MQTIANPDLAKLLRAIRDSEFNSADRLAPVWTDCLHHGFNKQKVGGLFSRAKALNLAQSFQDPEGDTCWLTEEGLASINAFDAAQTTKA